MASASAAAATKGNAKDNLTKEVTTKELIQDDASSSTSWIGTLAIVLSTILHVVQHYVLPFLMAVLTWLVSLFVGTKSAKKKAQNKKMA